MPDTAFEVHPDRPSPVPRKLLVIGYGFIGSTVVRHAERRGWRVRVLTRRPPLEVADSMESPTTFVTGDVQDHALAAQAIAGMDHVIYAVGDMPAGLSNRHILADMEASIPPLISVLETLRLLGNSGPALTYLSSGGTVYGEARSLPISEDHPTEPRSSYGILKLTSEKYVSLYWTQHGVRARILRCANAYGEGQPIDRSQGAVGIFLERLRQHEPIELFGGGEAVRDYIHVDDIAAAALALIDLPADPRILNVGSGVGTSLRELISELERVSGIQGNIVLRPARALDVKANVLDIRRLQDLTEFTPRSLASGIERVWRSMRLGTDA